MRRRKFLIGAGSLMAAGTAAVGTGAFATQSQQGVAVDVTGGASSFVGVKPETSSEYVETGSPMSIDLASAAEHGGSGVSEMSDTAIVPAFNIANQSDETLYIEIDNPLANKDITTPGNGEAPAGVDVQFLSAPSLPLKSHTPALIGRNEGTNSNPLGPEFDDLGSNGYWFHSLEGEGDDRSDRTTLQESRGKSNQGALELSPGESYPVVFRVIARDPNDPIPETSFRIEAYDNTDDLNYDVVSF